MAENEEKKEEKGKDRGITENEETREAQKEERRRWEEEQKKRREEIESLKQRFRKVRNAALVTWLLDMTALLACCLINRLFYSIPFIAWFSLWTIFVLSSVTWYGTYAVKFVNHYERGLIECFREYLTTVGPGLQLTLPPFERIIFVQVWEIRVDIPPQAVITQDPIPCKINAVVWYKIENFYGAHYNVEDLPGSILEISKTNLRNLSGTLELIELVRSREKISEDLQQILQKASDETSATPPEQKMGRFKRLLRKTLGVLKRGERTETDTWGTKITRAGLQYIDLPPNVDKALEERFAAGQQKIATILKKEGEAEGIKRVKGSLEGEEAVARYLGLAFIETLKENTKYFVDFQKIPGIGKLFKEFSEKV